MPTVCSVGKIAQIPEGEGRIFEVARRRLAVFRSRDGQVFATQAECPHRGGPLADGLIAGTTLTCPLHEWRFDLATGEVLNGACPLQVFRSSLEADGTIYVEVP
jgi:nitrite reductase (NADH) small subunit